MHVPTFEPMLASTGALPRGDLSWEPKWDGWRTQARIDGAAGELWLLTRSGRQIEGLRARAGRAGRRRWYPQDGLGAAPLE